MLWFRERTKENKGRVPSDDTDALARADTETQTLEHGWEVGSVAHNDLVELDRARSGPVLWRSVVLDDRVGLRGQVRVVDESLRRVHIVLDFGALPDHPRKGLTDREDVGQDETSLRRRDSLGSADTEHGDGEGEARAEKVETETEPPLVDHGEVVGAVLDVEEVLILLDELGNLAVRADGGETAQRLGKVCVERRAKDVVEAFEFSGTGIGKTSQRVIKDRDRVSPSSPRAVEARGESVEAEDRSNDEQEPLLDDRDQDDRAKDGTEGRNKHSETVAENVVDRVDVLAETVRDAPEGRRVEKAHGTAEDALDRSVMEASRNVVADPRGRESHDEREDCLHDSEECIHALVCKEWGSMRQLAGGIDD